MSQVGLYHRRAHDRVLGGEGRHADLSHFLGDLVGLVFSSSSSSSSDYMHMHKASVALSQADLLVGA